MSDETNGGPMAVPTPATPYMMQPTPQQLLAIRDQSFMDNLHRNNDAARAAAPQVTLVCVAPFTIVDDENPDGRTVNRGDEFTVSEFDLPRYYGRGLFRGQDPRRHTSAG